MLFRNDQRAGNRFVRFHLRGTTSNRDAIGATVRIFHGGTSQSRLVKSGSSYLSQSELPVTFGVGTRDRIDRVVVSWPNGRSEEFRNVATGKAYDCVEGKGFSHENRARRVSPDRDERRLPHRPGGCVRSERQAALNFTLKTSTRKVSLSTSKAR